MAVLSFAFVNKSCYTYDSLDRLTSVKYNNSQRASYAYNAEGALGRQKDYASGETTRYAYDLAGRLTGVRVTAGTGVTPGTLKSRLEYAYQTGTNRLESYSVVTPLGSSCRYGKTRFQYAQNGLSDRVDAVYYGQSTIAEAGQTASPSMKQVLHYGYDGLNRRTVRQAKLNDGTWYTTNYTYASGGVSGSATTRLETVKNGSDASLGYYYDANGNIETIYEGTELVKQYIYNEQNWLVQENDYRENKTWMYLYDKNGNIDDVSAYSPVGTTSGYADEIIYYGYNGMEDDERWDDLLTWYDDTAITYDAYHNPKNWRNGMTFSWGNGSQLTAVGLTAGGAARYKYDASGARYEKTVGGVTTSYHLIDGVAYGEKRSDGVELQYLYDENGRVYGLRKGGILYYFLFNGQGDVIGIVDEYETLQCRYAYDAWGKVLSVKDASGAAITNATHIGNLNPFRYRGYYYDVETGFYYLNSRYYDPTVKRFLTMDCQLGANGDVAALNMYAYCGNNPVAREDSYGTSWDDIKAFGDGLKDGFTGFFTDAADAIQNLPNTISDAVGYIKDDPVGALTSGLKASVSNILDPFGGRQKIYNFGKSLLDGDAYGAGHIAGGHAAESAVAIASYGAGKAVNVIKVKGLKIEKVGMLKPSNKDSSFPGIKYSYNKGKGRAVRSLELHPNHFNHGIHFQLNKWNPKWDSISVLKRWRIW